MLLMVLLLPLLLMSRCTLHMDSSVARLQQHVQRYCVLQAAQVDTLPAWHTCSVAPALTSTPPPPTELHWPIPHP